IALPVALLGGAPTAPVHDEAVAAEPDEEVAPIAALPRRLSAVESEPEGAAEPEGWWASVAPEPEPEPEPAPAPTPPPEPDRPPVPDLAPPRDPAHAPGPDPVAEVPEVPAVPEEPAEPARPRLGVGTFADLRATAPPLPSRVTSTADETQESSDPLDAPPTPP